MSELAKEILKKAKEEKATFVDLGNCGLDGYLPEELFDEYFIENLTMLSLGIMDSQNQAEHNRFKGDELFKLSHLKHLTKFTMVNDNYNKGSLSSMEFIEGCKNLEEVNLMNNQIKKIGGLNRKLQTLYLGNNEISKIEELNENLQTLYLYNNKISKIEGLNENLQHLYLNYNKISKIKSLNKNLQTLELSSNKINEIEGLNENLQHLYLNYNKISKIKGLNENLLALELRNNHINKIEGLNKNLQFLCLSNNRISKIEGLNENLEVLDLSNNKIESLEPLIPSLIKEDNRLQVIALNIPFGENGINMFGNPLTTPPMEIVHQGNEAILNWFKAREQASIINLEAKCILFGNGKAGKTTLSHQLRKDEFIEDYESTHGIIIKEWKIPKADFPDSLKEKIMKSLEAYKKENPDKPPMVFPELLLLNIWDFGGQEYYHATHRFFMSSNVLYLLIWEEQTNRQKEVKKAKGIKGDYHLTEYPVPYWQSNINHFSPRNITLNIQNKVTGKSFTDKEFMFKIDMRDKTEKSIQRYNDDIDELKSGIYKQIANLSHIGIRHPKVYDDIRKALRNETGNYMTFDEYKKLCIETDQTPDKIMNDDSQIKTLTNFLDDTGAIVCFRFRENIQSENLKNYVFTKPQWLTEVMYSILKRGKDSFDKKHVENVTSKFGLEADHWIEMMKQFELIFELKKNKQPYIVPQYLDSMCNDTKTLSMSLKGRVMQHAFTLYYPVFLPGSNFLRFIANYGSQSEDNLYWKEGIVFFTNDKAVHAECYYDERKISVKIQDKDSATAKELFETLIRIDEAENLQVSVNKTDFVDVKKLRDKVNDKNLEIESEDKKTLKVEEFEVLFGIKNYIDYLTKSKDEMEKKEIKIFISYSSDDRKLRDELIYYLKGQLTDRGNFTYKLWNDKDIQLGDNWQEEIDNAMKESSGAILLISAKFIESDFVRNIELPKFIEKKEKEGFLILPVLARSYTINGSKKLSGLQFFKTYHDDYGLSPSSPGSELMPFEELVIEVGEKGRFLKNRYCNNLADHIHDSFNKYFSK